MLRVSTAAAPRLKLLYITVRWPFGRGEEFLFDEVAALVAQGVEVNVAPREVWAFRPHRLRGKAERPRRRLCGWGLVFSDVPTLWSTLRVVINGSGGWKNLVKNLVVLPRAIFFAALVRRHGIEHIHAHWGSATSTMALVASQLTGVPWSMTLHRGDIRAANLLSEKIRAAAFTRCISQGGVDMVARIAGRESAQRCCVIPMGVRVKAVDARVATRSEKTGRPFTIVVPALLTAVKGHRYLLEACRDLKTMASMPPFRCLCIGDGELRESLIELATAMGVDDVVSFEGYVGRDRLLSSYAEGLVDVVVLPSIVTDEGEHEGIPVTLMEAMAQRVPVVSTRTGAIPELLDGGAGLLADGADSRGLALAILAVANEPGVAAAMVETGYARVGELFSVDRNVGILADLMVTHARPVVGAG